MNEFSALRVEREGDSFAVSIQRRKLSELAQHDILIEVQYSRLNYKDALSAAGNPGVSKNFPHTPGIDAVGRIIAISSDDASLSGFDVGDYVIASGYDLGMNRDGGLGQLVSCPVQWLSALPSGMTALQAMTLGTAGLTAGLCVLAIERAGITPSDGTIAITGSSGAVGQCVTALLSSLGFTVVAFSRRVSEKTKILLRAGAATVFSYDRLLEQSNRPLLKPEFAAAIDTLGGEYLAGLLKRTSSGGVVCACGLAADVELNTTVLPFILRGVALQGIDSVEISLALKSEVWRKFATDWQGCFEFLSADSVTLSEVPRLLNDIFAGRSPGNVVVSMDAS